MPNHKVLLLTSSYPRYKGDSNGNFVFELANRIKTSYDVFVIAPVFPGCKSHEVVDGITIYRHRQFFLNKVQLAYGSDIMAKIKKNPLLAVVVPFFVVFQFLMICKVVKKHKIRILHAHWLLPQSFTAVIYKIFNKNIRIISTIHGADVYSFDNFLYKIFIKFTLNNINYLTVVSNAIKNHVQKIGYNKNIFVYPMGIDTVLFSESQKDNNLKPKLNVDGFFLLFVGSLIERKGIRLLIQAMPIILDKFKNAKLIIIGDGNLKDDLIILCKDMGITESVSFLGSVNHEELPTYYATADIFILPSLSEGFGLVIVEALSCKTLAITSKLEPIKDIIIENETGLYFTDLDSKFIANDIIDALHNIEKFEHLRIKGREYVIKNFDWVRVSENYLSILNKCIYYD